MKQQNFLIQFRSQVDKKDWPWLILALRQDARVWAALTGTDLGKRALSLQPPRHENGSYPGWSPASLSLLAADAGQALPASPSSWSSPGSEGTGLQPDKEQAKARLNKMGRQAYSDWHSQVGPNGGSGLVGWDLARSGLLALALLDMAEASKLEERAQGGDAPGDGSQWGDIYRKLISAPGAASGATSTVLACLLGMSNDPLILLNGLLPTCQTAAQVVPLISALLSQPWRQDRQEQALSRLLASQNNSVRKAVLNYLSGQRPAIAAQLARDLFAGLAQGTEAGSGAPQKSENFRASTADFTSWPAHLEQLEQLVDASETLHLSGQAQNAIPLLSESIQQARRLEAVLNAQMGRLAMQVEDHKTAVESWKQAVQLAPDVVHFTAHLAQALTQSGRIEDAQAYLSARQQENRLPPHPALLLVSAQLAKQMNEIDLACQAAGKSLEIVQLSREASRLYAHEQTVEWLSAESEFTAWNLMELARLLADLDMLAEAAQAAAMLQEEIPAYPGLSELLAGVELRKGRASSALQASLLALALNSHSDPSPTRDAHQALFIECLEAAGEWETALQERWRSMENRANAPQAAAPGSADPATLDAVSASNGRAWRELANCALEAHQPQQALEACRQALELDGEDGQAHELMGEAHWLLGDSPAALDSLRQATKLASDQPGPWLSLSKALTLLGDSVQALEVLRAASLAAPKAAQIQLASGKLCQAEETPTQALAAFRRAAELHAATISEGQPQSLTKPLRLGAHRLMSAENDDLGTVIALHLGTTLRMLGHLAEARIVLQPAYEATPRGESSPFIDLAYIYARTLCDLGEHLAALQPLEQVVEAQPAEAAPYLDYTRVLMKSRMSPAEAARKAIPNLVKAISLSVDDQLVHEEANAMLAEALFEAGELERSLQAYQQVLEAPIGRQREWRGRLLYGLGRVHLKLGSWEQAISCLLEAGQLDPLNAGVQRSLADTYRAAGQQADALASARTALRLAPKDVELAAWFALLARDLPDEELQETSAHLAQAARLEAIEVLRGFCTPDRLETLPPQPGLLVLLGQLQMQVQDLSSASKSLALFTDLALHTSHVGFREATVEEISISDLVRAAQCLRQLEDTRRAVALLQKAISSLEEYLEEGNENQLPLPEEVNSTRLYVELSRAYRQAGRLPEALKTLEQALAWGARAGSPDPTELALEQSDLLLEMQQPEEALHCLLSALEPAPMDRTLRSTLHARAAILLRSQGQLAEALVHAQEASFVENHQAVHGRYLTATMLRAMLHNRAAREFLKDQLAPRAAEPLWLNLVCLQAEMALEAGENENAADILACIAEESRQQPRWLAAQARLDLRQGEPTEAVQRIEQGILAARNAPDASIEDWRGMAEGAIELQQWKIAFESLEQAAALAPNEPLTHLQRVRGLILRAESQRLCHLVAAKTHAPGEAALDEGAYSAFKSSLKAAEDELGRLTTAIAARQGGRPLNVRITSLLPQASQYLLRWRERGEAVFQPQRADLQAFEKMRQGAGDAAALVAAYGLRGDLRRASEASQAWLRHPHVLLWLAAAQAMQEPIQALGTIYHLMDRISASASLPFVEAPLAFGLAAYLAHETGKRQQDDQRALAAIQSALALWPDEPRWHALAADIYLQDGGEMETSLLKALPHLQEAVRLEPDYAPHALRLAEALQSSSRHSEAIQTLESACTAVPNDADLWLALGRAQIAANLLDEAENSLEQAIEYASDPTTALLLRAELALETNHPHITCSRAQQVLDYIPHHPQALRLLERALIDLDQPDEALQVLDQLVTLAEDPLPLMLERSQLVRRHRGVEAYLQALHELAQRFPKHPQVLRTLAEAYMDAGKREAAARTAQQVLSLVHTQLSPDETGAMHYLIGKDLRRSGKMEEAIEHLDTAIQHAPEHLDAYIELGLSYHERRQYAQALRIFQQAMMIAPVDFRPYYYAGQTLKESRDYQAAENMLRRAVALAPQEVGVHRLLGAVVALNLVHNRSIPTTGY